MYAKTYKRKIHQIQFSNLLCIKDIIAQLHKDLSGSVKENPVMENNRLACSEFAVFSLGDPYQHNLILLSTLIAMTETRMQHSARLT